MSKYLMSLLGGIALIGVAAGTASAGQDAPIDPAAVRDGKIAICHFGGHDGDFVLTGLGGRCDRLGGEILIVSCNAVKGHRVDPAGNPQGYCEE